MASVTLVLVSQASAYWQLGVMLVVYHCLVEVVLVTAATQMGVDLRKVFFGAKEPSSSSSSHNNNNINNDEDTDDTNSNRQRNCNEEVHLV